MWELQSDSSTSSDSSSDTEDELINQPVLTTPANMISTPTARGQFARFAPPGCLLNLSGEFQSDEESFEFFRARRFNPLDSSDEETEIARSRIRILDSLCRDSVDCYVYIDDFNSVERISLKNAISHFTTNRSSVEVLARKSEFLFAKVGDMARDINMKVN